MPPHSLPIVFDTVLKSIIFGENTTNHQRTAHSTNLRFRSDRLLHLSNSVLNPIPHVVVGCAVLYSPSPASATPQTLLIPRLAYVHTLTGGRGSGRVVGSSLETLDQPTPCRLPETREGRPAASRLHFHARPSAQSQFISPNSPRTIQENLSSGCDIFISDARLFIRSKFRLRIGRLWKAT